MNSFCANCHEPATYVCERCNIDYYCSVVCQKRAFSQHRFVCFKLPALRQINDSELIPQTPIPSQQNFEKDFENLKISNYKEKPTIVAADESKIQVVKAAVEPTKDPVKEKVKEVPVQKPAVVEKVKEIAEKPIEEQQPVKATTAFNQGPRSIPPAELTKKVVIPEAAKSTPTDAAVQSKPPTTTSTGAISKYSAVPPLKVPVIKEKTDSTEKIDVGDLRRNHQSTSRFLNSMTMNKPSNPPPQAPPKVEPKIFYSSMKVRDLSIGKHHVSVLNGDPQNKIFYLLENFEGVEEYCGWIESTVQEVLAQDKTTSYEPDIEEMVLACFEGVYYRAVSTGKKETNYIVFFIDYGNLAEVDSSMIKPFSPKLQMEIILHEVIIENLPVPLDKKAKNILANDAGFEIDVKEERAEAGSYIANIIGL